MPRNIYMPRHWWWLADDGRLFSSENVTITDVSDPKYIAWQGTDQPVAEAQIWPRDSTGAQTTASMQAVMDEYGITVP
ncbi:hypothetical protein [Bradyrhizobium sp. AZCC 2289]|uniref:hypothetical protein n=1 Tax=Bradyrhizobium sp. AZCC 2289 TaxID=3117026 RepID=UPI002FEF84D8